MMISIFLVTAYFIYAYTGFKTTLDINSQVNHIIKLKNDKTLKRIAANANTYDFLKTLHENVTSKNTSDAQGEKGDGVFYYVTSLNNRNIDLEIVKEDGFFRMIVPKWKVVKMSLQQN
ncbi:MAG: hypothetical protein E7150_09730 [Bacillus sp. (in: Bacteria)]|nr:hypothetical protein [Bacillus sp. (in: firmicutes)]